MPIESASTIAQLDRSYPLGGDPTSQGDDHLRLLKQVLKDQFPGALGDGFNTAILATEVELNYSVGLTDNIQDQFIAIGARLDDLEGTLSAPVGTRMTFNQPAPPVGWIQDVAVNDTMLRAVSGIGGGSGGSWVISGFTADTDGDHAHNVVIPGDVGWNSTGGNYRQGALYTYTQNTYAKTMIVDRTLTSAGNGSHSHNVSSDGNWRPDYIDVIIGIKD